MVRKFPFAVIRIQVSSYKFIKIKPYVLNIIDYFSCLSFPRGEGKIKNWRFHTQAMTAQKFKTCVSTEVKCTFQFAMKSQRGSSSTFV